MKTLRKRNPEEMIGKRVTVVDLHVVIVCPFSFKEGRFEAAVAHYTRALVNDPENTKVLSNRAACYYKLEQLDLCIEVRIRLC